MVSSAALATDFINSLMMFLLYGWHFRQPKAHHMNPYSDFLLCAEWNGVGD